MKIVEEQKRTAVAVTGVLESSDFPSLEFYTKYFPLPAIPDEKFIGTAKDEYFLLAVEALFTNPKVKLKDLNNFLTSEKRLDGLRDIHINHAPEEVNSPLNKLLRWRLASSPIHWSTVFYPVQDKTRNISTSIWEHVFQFHKDIPTSLMMSSFGVRAFTSNVRLVENLYISLNADGITTDQVDLVVERIRRVQDWYNLVFKDVNVPSIARKYEYSASLGRFIKSVKGGQIKLAAAAELDTPLTEVKKFVSEVPLEWAQSILTNGKSN